MTKKKEILTDNNIYISYLEDINCILEQCTVATHATHATASTETYFLKYDKSSGTIDKISEFTKGNTTYKPIVGNILDNNVILLPTTATEYRSVGLLVKQIKEFFNQYFEAPEYFQNLFPYLVLFYWVYDKFPFIPYLHFMGRTGTGKTTVMEVVGSICYKPIDCSGAITLASIFRVVSQWRGTLMIDEFNPGGEGYREMLSLLKSGVSDRAVLRVEGEKKREVKSYVVKSPKLFTSEKPINDAGLRSRVVEVKMEKNTRQVPLYRQTGFLKEAQDIRNKLLMWRFRKLNDIELSDLEYGYKELEHFDGRTQQVITPVYYMADEEARKDILKFAKVQEEETLRERRDSMDGRIFQFIMDNYPNTITLSMIFEEVTKDTKNKYVTPRKIGNVVRKILGIEIERVGHENTRTLMLSDINGKLKDLGKYYGISVPGDKVAQVAQVAKSDEELENIAENLFDN
jgi:hypothetical protein